MNDFCCAICRAERDMERLAGHPKLCPRHKADLRAIWHLAGLYHDAAAQVRERVDRLHEFGRNAQPPAM